MKKHLAITILSTLAVFFATTGTSHAALYGVDNSFANSGHLNYTFAGADFRTLAHLVRPDGTSIAIATYDNQAGCPAGRHCLGLYPFNAAGQPTSSITVPVSHSFSKLTGGIVVDPYLVKAAAIDSQGRIVIVGTEQFGSIFQFKVIRLLPNGQPDTSFDDDGIALPGYFTSQNQDFAESVAIDGSERIIVAGRTTYSATDTDFAVLRLTSTGALDTSFSGDGRLPIGFDLAGTGFDGATAVDIRPGGQIYLAGYASDAGVYRIALAKVLTSGVLDGDFCPTTCTYQGPYTFINSGKRVLYYGSASDNHSDFVSSMAVNVSGEMAYAGLHATGNGDFRVFTQTVALNGDYANEGLTDDGLAGPQTYLVGGIRYFNRNSGTSDLVLTGTTGPDGEIFFAQGLAHNLAPISNWGDIGESASVLVYSALGGFGDNPGNRPAIPSVDASGRVLLGGSFKATPSDPNYSINIARLSQANQTGPVFRDGFE